MNNTDVYARVKESFHQGSLLQSKNKISGEISKEPFLDILLTDLEQSSFSLVLNQGSVQISSRKSQTFITPGLEKESILTPLLTWPCENEVLQDRAYLKTSSYLFSLDKLIGKKKTTVQKISYLFSSSIRYQKRSFWYTSLIKPFFIELALNFKIKRNKKKKNLNYVRLSAVPSTKTLFTCHNLFYQNQAQAKLRFGTVRDKVELINVLHPKKVRESFSNTVSNCNSFHQDQKNGAIWCLLKVGDYVHCGDKIGHHFETPIVMSASGKILRISQTQITIQKMQPVLFYSQAEIHVESNEWVKRGTPILTLTHQTLVTGDIVQGIPRIEQLFEASTAAPPGAALQDFGSPSDDDSAKKSSIDNYLKSHHISMPCENEVVAQQNSFKHLLPLSSLTNVRDLCKDQGSALRSAVYQNELLEQSGEKRYARSAKLIDSTVHSGTEEKSIFLYKTLQSQVRETFRKKWDQFPLPLAVRQSLEEIQQIIVESIQKVYISQGVLIADKHIEIIVRQMTSKAQVFEGGSTGLLIDEILSLQQIENANISTPGQKALYLPVVMGLTRAALSSDSFVSAASFQETTRVLSRDAIAGKTDFLRGLKEKVIIGDLIDAGTGLDAFYIYSLFSRKIFENKFRDILNRKVYHKTLKKLVLRVVKPK